MCSKWYLLITLVGTTTTTWILSSCLFDMYLLRRQTCKDGICKGDRLVTIRLASFWRVMCFWNSSFEKRETYLRTLFPCISEIVMTSQFFLCVAVKITLVNREWSIDKDKHTAHSSMYMHKLIVSLSRLYPINKVTLDPLKIVKSVLNLELSA